jgi:hypothetical protein
MALLCPQCHRRCEFQFLREETDEQGRVWEVYGCADCGFERWYAVG